jgi:hypothetical protein
MSSIFDGLAYTISAKSRAKKHGIFLEELQPLSHETILDVGVNAVEYSDTDNYLEKFYPHRENITAVSLDDISELKDLYPEVTLVRADGTKLPFGDDTFDIAYSNAVIEHVGQRDNQQKFLNELVRVSRRGYLTTPNKFFPFEIHTRVPLLHILFPKKLFDTFLRLIGKSWATGDYMYLLGQKDLEALMSNTSITDWSLHKNTFCGFTMTLTLVWKK